MPEDYSIGLINELEIALCKINNHQLQLNWYLDARHNTAIIWRYFQGFLVYTWKWLSCTKIEILKQILEAAAHVLDFRNEIAFFRVSYIYHVQSTHLYSLHLHIKLHPRVQIGKENGFSQLVRKYCSPPSESQQASHYCNQILKPCFMDLKKSEPTRQRTRAGSKMTSAAARICFLRHKEKAPREGEMTFNHLLGGRACRNFSLSLLHGSNN
jgi:hypothetical protein